MPNLPCLPKKQASTGIDYEIEEKPKENENIEEIINVERKVYNYKNFNREHPSEAYNESDLFDFLREFYLKHLKPGKNCLINNIENRIPALKWIKNYRAKEYLLADLLAGLTVGIMHIPQGMAYALLASVPPIYGLYTSFYPVLIYWIFGTSRHISIGTFAVISLMVASTLSDLEPKYVPPATFNLTQYELNLKRNITNDINVNNFLSLDREKARIMIVMANSFWVGVIQLGMFIFQLGFITSYLSEPLVNGFLAGSAIHVLTSQFKFLFGLKLFPYDGIFKIPKIWVDLFIKIPQIHVPTLIISTICIILLSTIKFGVNERFAHKMPVPFPTELIIVVFGTSISYLTKLSTNYHINIIGPIPAGLPGPEIPPLFIIKDMVVKCFLTAVIAYAINFSLADLFSRKQRYKINPTQELLAYGASNIFQSFFPCFTSGASLARSCVQYNSGGKTQLVSIVSCVIIGFVLLFIAPLFKELPQACLASIIVVALFTLFKNLKQLPFYWRINKIEFFLFLLTFTSVSFLDVDIGLGIGVAYYILAHIVRSTKPYATLLGHITGTELYKDTKLYKDARELHLIKIVRVQSELHASNSSMFKKLIYDLTNIKPQYYLLIKNKIEEYKKKIELAHNHPSYSRFFPKLINNLLYGDPEKYKVPNTSKVFNISGGIAAKSFLMEEKPNEKNFSNDEISCCTEYEINFKHYDETESQKGINLDKIHNINIELNDYENYYNNLARDHEDIDEIEDDKLKMPKLLVKFIIIDCSPINYIDSTGIKTIKQLIMDYNEIGIKVYLADCNDAIRHKFKMMEKEFSKKEKDIYIDDNLLQMTIHDAVISAIKILRK